MQSTHLHAVSRRAAVARQSRIALAARRIPITEHRVFTTGVGLHVQSLKLNGT